MSEKLYFSEYEDYRRRELHDKKRENALEMAWAREKAAEEWFKTHVLTKDTEVEFKSLMKSIDKSFNKQQQ